jgi:hypothetical protein
MLRDLLFALRERRKMVTPPYDYHRNLWDAYRAAGMPYGETREGFIRWLGARIRQGGGAWVRSVTAGAPGAGSDPRIHVPPQGPTDPL